MECKGTFIPTLEYRNFVLIETYWNVKCWSHGGLWQEQPGINRNILECKVHQDTLDWVVSHCINRNILECKDGQMVRLRTVAYRINRNILECKVQIFIRRRKNTNSINRNILECKGKSHLRCISRSSVLIETYWNVKRVRSHQSDHEASINRNILECKVSVPSHYR